MDKQYFSLFNPPDKLSELRREQEEYDNDNKKQNIKEYEKTNIKRDYYERNKPRIQEYLKKK